MVNVDAFPCIGCVHFNGVKQPDGTENTEYVACKKADNGNAITVAKLQNAGIICNRLEKEDGF